MLRPGEMPWLPRFIHTFSWDDSESGLYHHHYDEAQHALPYAELVAHLAHAYRLNPDHPPPPAPAAPPSRTHEQPPPPSPPPPTANGSPQECHALRKELCSYNAHVARSVGQGRVAHIWDLLAVFLPGGPLDTSPAPHSDESTKKPEATPGGLVRRSSPQALNAAESGASEGSGVKQAASPLPPPAASTAMPCLDMLRRPLLTSLIEELLDQGDVQTCVAICEVVASTGGGLRGEQLVDLLDLSKNRLRECYLGYIGGSRPSHRSWGLVGICIRVGSSKGWRPDQP